MDNDKRKKVYDVLTSKTGYKDSFDDFNKFMDDGAARRKVYDVLREQTGYRDSFEDFDKFMSSSHQGEMPVPIVPMRPTEPDLSFSNPSAGKFVQNGLDANEELLNDVKAEPVKDGMGRSYFPVKPQKVMEDEIRREYQVEPIESQINNAIVANEEAIRRIEQGKTEDYDRKAEEHPFLHALGGFARQHEGRVPDVNPSNDKEALRNLYAERNKLEEAKKVLEASRTDGILSNIGAGVKDAVTDMGFYDFGMTEMSDNSRLLGIKAKLDNKQPLTEDEQKLLNAAALAQGVQSSHQDRISPWYTAGQTTANMAPFMAEMLVNPAAGLGKAAQKAVTKKVSGLVGKSLAKKMLPKLSRVAGDVAGASVMTGTTGIMRTVADAEGRMLGDVNSSIRDGEIVGNGFSGGLDAGEASAKAFGANTIENWSEMLGEYFSPALKGMGMVANKGMRKMGLGRVSDFISDINSTSLARGIDDFLEKTQWNGPIGEIAEEEAGIIANSYITGDNKLSDLTDPRLQLDIVLGVGLFGGFVSGMKTIGYRSPSKIAEKDLKRAEKNASSMFDNWEDIRLEIENTDEEQLPDTLNSIIGHAAGNDNAKKAAIVDYAYSLQKWRGVNAAKLKQTVENPAEAQNLVENEEDGTGAEATPDFDKVSVYRNFKRAERKVAQALPNTSIEKIEDVTDVDKFAADNGLNEEQRSAVTDYIAAKEPYSIYQSDVEARKEVVKSNAREQAVKDAERMSNPDTGFITQVKHKFSETPVYLVGGNLSFGDDGLLDRSNSTETVYYLDENGKRLPAPAEDFDSIVSQSSKEELVANAEAQATADFDAQENESLASPEILPPGIGETVSLDGGTYVIEGADNDNPGNFSAFKLNADGEREITPGLSEQISLSPDEYYEAKEAELWKNDGIQPEQPVGKVDEVVAPALVQGVDKMPEISAENASGPEMEDNKVSEETPEQRLQKVVDSLPKKKDGNIDYKALTPQQRFDYTSAAESPEVAIEDLKSDVAAKNEELEKINARLEKAIGGERVELRDTIRSKKKELDELTAFFQSVVPEQPDTSVNEEQPSVPEDVRTDEDYVEWVADNSDDAEEVLGAYSVAKELASHEWTLKPWQRELLGRKVSTSSFVRFGDRNHITGTLAKGWLRKDGEEIDSIAQELTANGVDVSEQDIVDFILDNPSNRVSEISDTMRSLSSRFSEIATKETGIPVGGPESNTGKLYIQLKEANKKIDELTDEQKADMRNALIADMDASDVQRSGDYYESLADYAEQYDRFRDEMNAEEADEAVIRQMEAESPTLYHGGFTADELDDIYSQIENDNGTERQTEDSGETQPALSGDEIEQREEPGIPDAVGAEDSESEGQDSGVVPDIEEIQDNTLDNEDESLSLHLNSKEEENGTISESVPQGEHREEAPQNPRMEEASIGLRDRVEASTRNAQASGGTLSERKKQEIEQRSAESYAKETGQWIPMSDIFAWQPMPSGNENDVYLNTDDGQVYKVNNLMNSKGILPLFDRLRLHNQLFPESRYEFVGFTGFDNGSVFPIFKQEYVNDAEPASPEEIDSYMRSLGFKQTGEAAYSNGDVVISDLRPRNVLKDTDGDLYVVDADFKTEDSGVVPDIEEIQDNTLDGEYKSLSSQSEILNVESDEHREVESLSGEGAPFDGTNEADAILRRAGDRTAATNGRSSWTKDSLLRDVLQRGKKSKTWIENLQSIAKKEKIGAGGENDVYLSNDGRFVIKVNNFSYLPDSSSNFDSFMNRVDAHNELFPNDAISVLGFSYNSKGEVSVVLSQPYIRNAREATQEEIDAFLEEMGFYTDMSGNWTDGTFDIADTKPNNVLVDEEGLLHFIDVLSYDSRKPGRMLVIPKQAQKSFKPSPINPGENVLDYAERISREKEMHDVRQSVDTNPTDAQKEAGNYKKGHIRLDGYDITIENPKGSERSGTDAKGGKWSVTMNNDYGYIRGTQGVDGDHIDVFLSDDPTTGNVYVIDQVKEDGSFDEHKVMYGFGSALAAKRAYLSNYSKGWNGLGKITQVSKDEFRKWVNSSRRKTKPFAEYKSVKMESDIRTDRQGNPVDADGKLIIEDVNSINDITDADFTNPTRSIGLPAIPRNVSDAIGADGKRVIIKKNIFEKNGKTHAFAPQASRDILERALYNPDIVGQSQPNTKKNHWIAIKLDDKSPIVVLEVNNNKDNVEIVGWYTLDNRNLDRIRRQAEREGGELLILTSKEAAASLSTLPLDLPSADKDSEQSDNKQEMQENTSSALDAAMEKLGDIEQKWEDRILDYIAEHYPTQATVSAQTNSPEGMRERMAMKNDETLKRMREQAQTEFNAADEKVMSLYRRYKTSLGEDDIRFRDIDTEDKEELVAVHNISEEKLKEALDLGGFPMPSIAITKADVGHTTFGDISLVFDKESINPTDRRNKVYGEDAWTPTFPNVGYKLNGDKTSDIYRRANKVGRLPLFNPTSFHPDSYERYINGLGAESLVNHFKNDYNAKQLYLSETGNAVEEYERHEVDKYLPDKVALYEKVLTEIGIEKLKNERNDALENDVKRFIEEHYNIDLDAVKPHIAKTRINNTIRYAIDYAENGNKVTENDFEATKKKIDERIDPKKFEEWLEELFTDVVEKKGIRNDKDLFTPSGNSRKWEQLYDEITLDNVVNAMQKQAAKGGQGLFGASIFGAAQEEYKSIDEIRKAARERIRTMDEADYKAQRDVITDRLSDIKIPGVGNGFSDTMDMVQNIQDAVARSHTAKGIYKYLKEFYPKVTMEAANEIADIVKDIQRMSARYFEAKPYRAVGFDEVRLAVVPSDTDANLVEQLKHLGIEVRTYDHGNEGQRGQIVKEATDEMNLRFRENDEVNRKFNEELQLQIDGTLPEGHVYQLGNPSRELLSAGIPDLPIELSAERLEKKASKEYESNHPFNLESIKNLPQALNYPIAVFEARKKNGAKVVLTELNENGNNFIAAIKVRKSDDSRTVEVEVNDIRSLYPKDRKSGILEWINSGLLKWVDKNKASDFFSTQWPNYIGGGENKSEASDRSLAYISASALIADATYKEELSSATKIVENFNNPTPEQGEIISAVEELSSRLNTPVHIIRSLDELTDGAARRAIMSGRRGIKSWFTDEEVALYLPHATGTDDARRSVLHEVVGHKGLRDLFGKKGFDGMMEKLYGQLPDDVRREIHDTAKGKYSGDIAVAMDEYLAGQAELDETPSWWNRVVSAVRGFLREMGVDVLLSSNDVKYLLWKSKNRLMNSDNGLDIINKIAAGEHMKEKLHIGEYSRTPEQEKADYDKAVKIVGDFAGSHAGAANALVIRSRDLMRRQLEARGISAEDIEKYEQWFDEKGTCAFWSPKYQTIFVLNKSVSEKEINGYLWHENVHHAFDVLYGSEEKKSRIARLYEELSPYSASDFAHIEGLYVDESVETQKEECVTALFEELTKRYEGKTEDVISKMQGKGIISDSTLKELYNYIHYGTKEGYGSRRIRPGFDGFLEKPVEEKTMEVRNSDGDFRRSAESEGSGHPVRGMVEEGAGSISGTGESGAEERNKGNRPLGRGFQTDLDMRNSGDAGHHKEEKGAGSQRTEPRAKEGNQTGEGVTRFRDTTDDKPSNKQKNSDGTREAYEKAVNTKGRFGKAHLSAYNFHEAFHDEMLSLKILQEVIEKHSGKKLKGFENAYLAENRLGSINLQERNRFIEELYEPMMKIVDGLMREGVSEKEMKHYLIAKSGLERNREFAVRDAIAAEEKENGKEAAQKLRKQYETGRDALRKKYSEGKLSWDEYQDELDKLAALYADKFPDYSGLTAITGDKKNFTDIAKDIVKDFEAGHDTKALWDSIDAATKFSLKKSYESGIMGKETYDHVKDMFEYYIPMRGWEEETAEDVYDYIRQERGTFSATIRKAEGHQHESYDPFAIIGNMAESAILQGNRNLMKQKFMNMVLNHPSDVATLSRVWFKKNTEGKWEASFPDIAKEATADEVNQAIREHEEEMRELEKDGKAKYRSNKLDINYHIDPKNASQHAVVVKRGGKDFVIYINGNPRAAEALNGQLKPGKQNVVWDFYDYLKRNYAAGVTSYNVNFAGTNVVRDVQHAFFITYIDKGIVAAAKLAKNGPKALKVVARGVSGRLNLNRKEDNYYKEFLENGGETGYSNLNSIEKWKADNDKRMARLKGLSRGTGYVKEGIKHLADWFEFANRIFENCTRFNAYMLAREDGKTISESINEAKDITLNFNKKGSGQTPGLFGAAANIFRRWFLFANPIIQGLYQMARVAKKNKARLAFVWALHTATGFVVPMLNAFLVGMYGDDDDDYFYQNDYTRRSNLMLYVPGVGYIKIPLAPVFRNMYAMGDILYMKVHGFSTTEEAFWDSVNEARTMLSIDGQSGREEWSVGRFLIPDLFGPLLDIADNENFAGSPIYKDTEYNKFDPEFKKVYKNAWAPLVELSKLLNDVAGGNDYRKSEYLGKWINPAAMQHLITNYTGGVGQLIGDVSSLMYDVLTGKAEENFDMMKVPVGKRFFTIPDERTSEIAVRRKFFKIKDYMDALDHEIKARAKNLGNDLSQAKELSELQNSPEYDRLLVFKEIFKLMNKEEILPEMKVELMKQFLEWYDEEKKKQE